MVLLRAGLVASLMLIFLVVAPVSAMGGRTGPLHEEVEVSGVAESPVRESDSSVELRSPGFSGRKMLAAEGPTHEAPTGREQLDAHASTASSTTVPSAEKQSTTTAPAAPAARFAARFAFLFRSLAKGSSPPSTGTPSPGHN